MMKIGMLSNRLAFLALFAAFFFVSGCASTQVGEGLDRENWAGNVTGEIDSDFEMSIVRLKDTENTYHVRGSFAWDIEGTAGGFGGGRMTGRLEGRIVDGILKAAISGHAKVSEGSARITGSMEGNLSEEQASGTWRIKAHADQVYYFSGQWSAEKASL
jgi:hypothetical protein